MSKGRRKHLIRAEDDDKVAIIAVSKNYYVVRNGRYAYSRDTLKLNQVLYNESIKKH